MRTTQVFGASVVLGLWLAALSAGASGGSPASASAGGSTQVASEAQATALLDAGRRLALEGRLREADERFRKAWWWRATRTAAATELRALHDRRDFELPVDEEAVGRTLAALGPGFNRSQTRHFVVLSNCDTKWTTGRAELLERAHHEFFRVLDQMEHPAHPPRARMLCVLVRDHADYARFALEQDGVSAGWIAGYYAGLSNRVVFYDDLTGPAFRAALAQLDEHLAQAKRLEAQATEVRRGNRVAEAEHLAGRASDIRRFVRSETQRVEKQARLASQAKTIHEAIHLLAFNCGVQSRGHEYPFWLTEGLALAFETDRPLSAFGPGREGPARREDFERCLSEGRLKPLEEMVVISEAGHADAETADVLYSQAFGLFEHLHRHEAEALREYLLAFFDAPAGEMEPSRQRGLFVAHFGDPARLERRWLTRATAAARAEAPAR